MAVVPGHQTESTLSPHAVERVRDIGVRRSVRSAGTWLTRNRWLIAFAVVAGATVFVIEQVLVSGTLVDFDYYVHYLRLDQRYPSVYNPIFYLVMLGQRGPTAIPAFVVACILAWRRRSWRPALALGLSLLTLNLIVGVGKLWTARLKPSDNSTALFSGGIIFPSGHASNVVVTWGVVAYLLVRYGPLRKYWPGALVTTIATLIVGLSSIYLDTHWVSDILAGWLLGLAIVMATVWLDRRVPAGWSRRLRRLLLGVPGALRAEAGPPDGEAGAPPRSPARGVGDDPSREGARTADRQSVEARDRVTAATAHRSG